MSVLFLLCFCLYKIVLFVAYFPNFAQNAWEKIRKNVLFVAFVVPTVNFKAIFAVPTIKQGQKQGKLFKKSLFSRNFPKTPGKKFQLLFKMSLFDKRKPGSLRKPGQHLLLMAHYGVFSLRRDSTARIA